MSDATPHEALSGLVPRAMMEARERTLQAEIERLRAALAKIGEDRAWLPLAEFARHVLADEGKP